MVNNMNKRKKKILIIAIVIISIVSILIIRTIFYHKTYNYKLGKIGYTENEIAEIKKLDDEYIDYILTIDYNKNLKDLLKEKYFLKKNLKEYIEYMNSNKTNTTDAVAVVNVGANHDWYTNTKETDLSKGNLILANKFYRLSDSYDSSNMVKVSIQHSFGENQMLTSETYDAFKEMFNAALDEGLKLVINSSFRSFEEQEATYEEIKNRYGEAEANRRAAKPGYSEHQTGMAIDIQTFGSTGETFEDFDEFKWLQNNAHKYGFILRYPKGKEFITGYEYESWHYRYVGVDVATYIKENGITFDEYYAYFIEKD